MAASNAPCSCLLCFLSRAPCECQTAPSPMDPAVSVLNRIHSFVVQREDSFKLHNKLLFCRCGGIGCKPISHTGVQSPFSNFRPQVTDNVPVRNREESIPPNHEKRAVGMLLPIEQALKCSRMKCFGKPRHCSEKYRTGVSTTCTAFYVACFPSDGHK